MGRVYSSKVDPYKNYILQHYKEFASYRELTNAINTTFSVNLSEYTVRDWLRKQLNTTNVYGVRNAWSEYELTFLKNHYEKDGPKFVAQMLKKSLASVTDMAFRQGLKSSDDRRIANGRRQLPNASIGTIRSRDSHGELTYYIKVAPGHSGWMPLSRYIWEQNGGQVPDGYNIIFLNGKREYDVDNMEVVSRSVFLNVTSNKHYKTGDPELTRCLIRYYQLRDALGVSCYDIKNFERKMKRKYKLEVE